MSDIKNILFDWDGTLAYTLNLWLTSYQKTFMDNGVEVSDKDIPKILQRKGHKQLINAIEPDKRDEFYNNVDSTAVTLVPNTVKLYPNARESVTKLHAKDKKLGIVTNSDSNFIGECLKSLNLEAYFDVVITSDMLTVKKPDPEGLLLAVKMLSANKDETVYIGDMVSDIEAAKAAGIKSVLYYPEENHYYYAKDEFESSKPDFIIKDLIETVDLFT